MATDNGHEYERGALEQQLGGKVSQDEWRACFAANGPPRWEGDDLWVSDSLLVVRRWRENSPVEREPHPVDISLPPDSDEHRWGALRRILAAEASREPDVRQWRARHLPQAQPSPEQLRIVLAELRRTGETRPPKLKATLYVKPDPYLAPGDTVTGDVVEIESTQLRYTVPGETQPRAWFVSPDSPLGELERIARRLSTGFPWREEDAATFVMTGTPPPVYSLSLRLRLTGRAATSRAVLEFDPRVSLERIQAAIGRVKEEAKRELPSAGRQSRRLDERTGELAAFLAQHRDESWTELETRWNGQHPAWRFRNFIDAAQTAWERVVGGQFVRETEALKIQRAGRVANGHPPE